eukprot:scaffold2713_cov253-Chaetoceros_neogracile.AAC.12
MSFVSSVCESANVKMRRTARPAIKSAMDMRLMYLLSLNMVQATNRTQKLQRQPRIFSSSCFYSYFVLQIWRRPLKSIKLLQRQRATA